MDKYIDFIKDLDARLEFYFNAQAEFVCCQKGCSACCEKGEYPLSDIELRYLMLGYAKLENNMKIRVQKNISNMEKGGKCPFLINSECSIYPYRPIICRTHGLAYLTDNGIVKLPYCVNEGKNFSSVYKDEEFYSEPIKENLNTQNLLKDFEYSEFRNLYDWLKNSREDS